MSKLIGKQAKLDRNKNGKLDSEDFKMLRAGKKKAVKEQFIDRVVDVLLEMRLNEGEVKARNKASKRFLMQARGGTTEGPAGVAAGRAKSRANPPTQGTAGGGSAEGTPIQRKVKLDARQGLQSKKIP